MNIASLTESKPDPNIPPPAPGDTVKVSVRVVEGDKERLQVFQGVVIKIRRSVDGGSFTVRRVSRGIGVERTFLFQSPMVDKVEVVQHGKVRRAKLYYLRQRSGKMARLKERRVDKLEPVEPVEPEEPQEEPKAEAKEEPEAEAKEEPEES